MKFVEMFLSGRILVSIMIAALVCLVLTFFPLIGALGFEYAAATAFVLALVSVFLAGEFAQTGLKQSIFGRRVSDNISSIFFVNFVVLAIAYLIGLGSSLVKKDCYIAEGSVFFLLIPAVTVFFSTSLGLLSGYVFGRRGFFIAALAVLAIVVYSLYKLYAGVSLFVYNPVYGFFPGPLYDEDIPVTNTLVIYRASTFLWGVLMLLLVRIYAAAGYRRYILWDFILTAAVVSSLIAVYSYREDIGFDYSRGYITKRVLPGELETEHFVIHYAPGAPEAQYIDLIAADHEWRFMQLSEFLDVNPSEKIRSYIYPNVKSRKKYVGAGDTTIANPVHGEIHLVYEGFPHPILKHELTHVMAGEFGTKYLRVSPKIGLLEGIAVAADWDGADYDRHEWSKSLIQNGMAPDIGDIAGFGFWYAPSQVSYTLMGSFSRYLIDTYGIGKFKKLYATGDFSVYGKPLSGLVSEWKRFLDGIEIPEDAGAIARSRFGEPAIFGAVCPRRVASLKNDGYESYSDDNFHEAGESFSRALAYDPSDPSLVMGLAYSQYYGGDYEAVKRTVAEAGGLTEVDANMLGNLLANVTWQEGDPGTALGVFESLYGKPLPEDVRRELDIKVAAISAAGSTEEKIREFFSTRDRIRQTVILSETIGEDPGFGVAHYLLGRLLYNEAEYEDALPFLWNAYLYGLPSERLVSENMRLLGISMYAAGEYGRSAEIFDGLSRREDETGVRDYAADFAERARWAERRVLNK